jgi:hypothetical protein
VVAGGHRARTVDDKGAVARLTATTPPQLRPAGAVVAGSSLAISNTELSSRCRRSVSHLGPHRRCRDVIRTPFLTWTRRAKYLFAGNLSRPAAIPESVWNQRSVAVTRWSNLSALH